MELPSAAFQAADAYAVQRDLQRRMEQMFEDPQLTELRLSRPAHPAVARYDALERLRREQGSLTAHDLDALVEAQRQTLDTMMWVPRSADDDVWSVLTDAQARERTIAALRHEEQYEDVLAELHVLGWLLDNGFRAERTEEAPGLSDLVIDRGTEREVRADVKRIHADTGPRGLPAVVRKANKQIKRSDPPGGGVAFISLGLPIRRAPADDGIPSEVEAHLEELRGAMRADNSSVSCAVVTWEDFLTVGSAPAPMLVAVRRRAEVVEHARPRRRLAIASSDVRVGGTSTVWAHFAPAGPAHQTPEQLVEELRAFTILGARLGDAPVRLMEMAREDAGGLASLRPEQVARAFRRPSGAVVHDTGVRAAIVTQRLLTRASDSVLVLHAIWSEDDGEWQVGSGHRLFDRPQALAALAKDPNRAFSEVLVRYGSRFRVDDGHVWWAPSLNLQLPPGHGLSMTDVVATVARSVETAPENCALKGVSWFQHANVVFFNQLHWINTDRYRAALVKASRRRR